jgi:hypothetical protein
VIARSWVRRRSIFVVDRTKGNVMTLQKLAGCSAIVAISAMFASVAPTQATMYHTTDFSTPYVQRVDCAVGFHLGPVGTCVVGADEPRAAVVEHRDDNAGCEKKTITKQDSDGNSMTKTKTNC